MDNFDTTVFMVLGITLVLGATLGLIGQTVAPLLAILLGITGLVTFFVPMILTTLEG